MLKIQQPIIMICYEVLLQVSKNTLFKEINVSLLFPTSHIKVIQIKIRQPLDVLGIIYKKHSSTVVNCFGVANDKCEKEN